MTPDLKDIKRRERRFYRVYDDGEIKYTDAPKKEEKTEAPIITNPIKIEEKDTGITDTEKKKIIDKILTEMNKNINPDIDEISDVIYSQLSNNNINISQETVKQVVENNVRTRRPNRDSNKTSSETLSYLNDRKEMELVLDNIVEENIKEITREKNKPKEEKLIIEKKETTSRRSREEKPKQKEESSKKKEESSKKEATKPKKEEFKLDFGEDTEEKIDENDEDLGLKF